VKTAAENCIDEPEGDLIAGAVRTGAHGARARRIATGAGVRDATGDMAARPTQAAAWLAKMKLTPTSP
jgi:hypothetical protein